MRYLVPVLAVLVAAPAFGDDTPRQIGLTFDDAPRSDGPFMTGAERTGVLIDALASVDVEGAMFFVTTRNLERRGEEGAGRLRRYFEAGHVLGNHSHAHMWLHKTAVEEHVADLDTAIERLAAFDGVTKYFRFPFLDSLRDMYVDDLVRGLRAAGWEIIPAADAYEDPIADYEPDTLFLGQGRIAALAHEAGRSPRDLVHLTEDEEQLRAEFIRRGLLR